MPFNGKNGTGLRGTLGGTDMSTRAHTVPKFYLNGFVAPGTEHERDPFVWVGSLTTGEITKRSPKNISISRGLYDGRGGFEESDTTIEAHLSKIESAASSAIRKFSATKVGGGHPIPPEITRFLAWQAARTPGWMELEQRWARSWNLLPAVSMRYVAGCVPCVWKIQAPANVGR